MSLPIKPNPQATGTSTSPAFDGIVKSQHNGGQVTGIVRPVPGDNIKK